MSDIEAPIACTLDSGAFNRRLAMIDALFRRSLRNTRLEGASLHLTFAPEARGDVDEFVRLERICCAFLNFDVREHEIGVELTITAQSCGSAEDLLSPFGEAAALYSNS